MNMSSLLLPAVMSLFLGGVTRMAQTENEAARINGTVVARHKLSGFLTDLENQTAFEFFILRVAGTIKSRQPRYILVSFERRFDEAELPAGLFETNRSWGFTLTRSPKCDCLVREVGRVDVTEEPGIIYTSFLEQMPGGRTADLPLEKVLDCYELKPGGVKEVR